MPLVACPDCSTSVSDRASLCPKCARPINVSTGIDPKVALFVLGILALVAGIVVWIGGGDLALAGGLAVGGLFVVAANTRTDNAMSPGNEANPAPVAQRERSVTSPAIHADIRKARRQLLLLGIGVLVVYLYVTLFMS
jgi:hypothetical protein